MGLRRVDEVGAQSLQLRPMDKEELSNRLSRAALKGNEGCGCL